jgi:hypothetical protein
MGLSPFSPPKVRSIQAATTLTQGATGVWTSSVLIDDALLFERSLATAPDGRTFIYYGVVKQRYYQDEIELMTVESNGSTSAVQIDTTQDLRYSPHPVAIYDAHSQLKTVDTTLGTEYLDAIGVWERYSHPSSLGNSGALPIRTVFDLVTSPDRRVRGLVEMSRHGWGIITFPSCQPRCSGKNCGGDGCGGSCGSCNTGESCSGAGVCTSWRYASLESDEPLQAIVAEQNTVHVLQGRGNYSRKSSGSFSALSTGSNSYYGWLSFDAQDTPNIAFAQNGSGYHDAYENGAFTRNKLPFTFVNSLRLPMVFDSQNTRYALFSTRSYLSSSHTWITKGKLDLGITDSNTGTSRRETIINLVSGSTAKTAEPMNLALDSSGHVHALWTNSTDNDVHYATNASGTWVDRRVTTAFSGIRSFFLADGTPYLCWKVNSDLFVGQVNQAPFKPEKLPISLSGGTSAIDCTANHAQRPAMLVGNTLLQKQADGSWTSETFPTFSDPLQVRVSFDTNGSPHVVYSMDVAGTFVRYASRP